MTILESLAYAIARGAVRAYFDVLAEGRKAVDETVTDDDVEFAGSFRSSIDRVRAENDLPTRHLRPPSSSAHAVIERVGKDGGRNQARG